MIFFIFSKLFFFRSERETDSSKRDYDSRPAKRSLLLLQRTNTEFEITIFIVYEDDRRKLFEISQGQKYSNGN